MKGGTAVLWAVAINLCFCTGCVERRMLIRSDPPGAPVWLDEQMVGVTPVELRFDHYGVRRVRIGPVRDAEGRVQRLATERMVNIAPPWYEEFPIDFFSEVLWPGTVVDVHQVALSLPPVSEQEPLYGEEQAEEVRKQAEEFRKKGSSPVPELQE